MPGVPRQHMQHGACNIPLWRSPDWPHCGEEEWWSEGTETCTQTHPLNVTLASHSKTYPSSTPPPLLVTVLFTFLQRNQAGCDMGLYT